MKVLIAGVVLIALFLIGGFLYRDMIESSPQPANGACTADAKVCPDGSAVGRVAPDCNFAQCASPNVTLTSAGIVFLPPAGYATTTPQDPTVLADFEQASTASTTEVGEIVVRDYAIPDGETASDVLHATALGGASGTPVSPSAFSATTIGGHTFSVVVLQRFEGVVQVAYYLPRANDVLRFEAFDRGVARWTDPTLDVSTLTTNHDLRTMLSTLENN